MPDFGFDDLNLGGPFSGGGLPASPRGGWFRRFMIWLGATVLSRWFLRGVLAILALEATALVLGASVFALIKAFNYVTEALR